VKVVMVGLVFASVVTWTVWLAKTYELWTARKKARAAIGVLARTRSLAEAQKHFGEGRDDVAKLVNAAMLEAQLSTNASAEGLKERTAWLLERLELAAGRQIGRGMGVLASIGAA